MALTMLQFGLFTTFSLSFYSLIAAQAPATSSWPPEASVSLVYTSLPHQTCPNGCDEVRGPQVGYNDCLNQPQNQSSMCQTLVMNNIADFCLYAPYQPESNISYTEAILISWCSSDIHGSRVIPAGSITGAQFLYAQDNSYMQYVFYLTQSNVDLAYNDSGGEEDGFGADGHGNPLGGAVFGNWGGMSSTSFNTLIENNISAAYGNSNEGQYTYWMEFIGSGIACGRLCNPSNPNAARLCDHIYDEIGCEYNAPANYAAINGTFEVCDTDNYALIGDYVVDGTTSTWTQGFTGIPTPPYPASIPTSSNCFTYASSQLYAPQEAYWNSLSSSASTTGSVTGTSSTDSTGTGSSGTVPTQTGSTSGTITGFSSTVLPYMTLGFFLTTTITIVTILM